MAPFVRSSYDPKEISLARESFNAIVTDHRAGNPYKVSNINMPHEMIRTSNLSRMAQKGPDWKPPGISAFGWDKDPPTTRPSSARAGYRPVAYRGTGLLIERPESLGAEAAQAYQRQRQKSCPGREAGSWQSTEVRPAGLRPGMERIGAQTPVRRCGDGGWQHQSGGMQTSYAAAYGTSARAAWRLEEDVAPEGGPTSLPGRQLAPARLHDPGQRAQSRPASGGTSGFGRLDQWPNWVPEQAVEADSEPNYDLEAVAEPASAYAEPGRYRACYGRR